MRNPWKGAKILILNNPCNPTGAVYPDQELQALAKVCREEEVIVISDEIYSLIDFRKEKFSSIGRYLPESTVVTGGISKAFRQVVGGLVWLLCLMPCRI